QALIEVDRGRRDDHVGAGEHRVLEEQQGRCGSRVALAKALPELGLLHHAGWLIPEAHGEAVALEHAVADDAMLAWGGAGGERRLSGAGDGRERRPEGDGI